MKRLFLDANVLFTAAHNPKGKAALLNYLDRFEGILDAIRLVSDRGDLPCPAELPEKDWPIYRAAHACRADVLLTGDLRDFGPLMNAPDRTGGLLIQTVAQFLSGL